ncbi:hypothetical protein HD806DRAFT_541659 [Xylariaceae sp. AK1471]|nr:hypothetical protein HD806DRAFT_541659 [Xylariaceae sp. AK1471]
MPSFKNLFLAAVAATATQAYSSNCAGSLLSPSLDACSTALSHIDPGTQYSDQSQFSSGDCYVIYTTNSAGAQPVSGQLTLNTAKDILNECSSLRGELWY